MNRLHIITLSSLALTLLPLPAWSEKPKTEKASQEASRAGDGPIRVNEQTIPPEEIRLLIADRQAAGVPASPALTNAVREQLIARELFAQEARKAGLDKSPEFLARARMAREEILARQYQAQYLARHAPAESDEQATYATLKQRAGNIEYRVRQIFVPTEDEAKGLINRLGNKELFEMLAKSASKDESSRTKGGDLGWLSPLQIQPQMVGIITALKKGEYTRSPVKGQNGWHVILVEDMRPYTLPPYEEMSSQLKRDLGRRALETHLAELRKKATVR